jgi:transcriptional regulator with XRE-family HTH domain
MKKLFNADAFYYAVANTVNARGVSWRQVSKDTGVSASTLTRMQQGTGVDAASLAALSKWASLNPAEFVGDDVKGGKPETIAKVTQALNSDTKLSPIEKRQLQQIVSAAYDSFTSPKEAA